MKNFWKIEEAYAAMSIEARQEAVLILQGLALSMPATKPTLSLVVSNDLGARNLRDGSRS